MKQIRIKSGTPQPWLSRNKWYDVIGMTGELYEIVGDNGRGVHTVLYETSHLSGGDWEIRNKPIEKIHEIKDSDLRSIYKEVCTEWKDRIKNAVPTFKVEKEWKDITERCGFRKNDVYDSVCLEENYSIRDEGLLLVLPHGLKWNVLNIYFEVENGKLWRRIE